MSVRHEPSGRRSVETTFEVPGTPEEIWYAIATGPGISSWFVPAAIEEQDGKPVAMKLTFGPGMEPRSEITAWDPPRSFTALGESWGGAPPLATEWNIESRSGGVCTVRIVQSFFASNDEWDHQLEGAKAAFFGFFRTLMVYLTHFRGHRCAITQFVAPVAATEAEAWQTITDALGIAGAQVSQPWSAPAGVPALSGVVEHLTADPYDALLRLEQPGPGVLALGTYGFPGGGPTMVAMNFYMYGDDAEATVARVSPQWQAWIAQRFPAPAEGGQ
jgi:uncharacterized protein YndB with AHSA1/START domain